MLINSLPGVDGSRCVLTLDEKNQWLRATWRGFTDQEEALRGADNYLEKLAEIRCAYLLNDNTGLRGPWFDSLDWLLRIWAPQAAQMGLRYVAHVVQADRQFDVISEQLPAGGPFELQVFQDLATAEHWLRQRRDAAGPAA